MEVEEGDGALRDGATTLERLIVEGHVAPPGSKRHELPPPLRVAGTVSDLIADQRR